MKLTGISVNSGFPTFEHSGETVIEQSFISEKPLVHFSMEVGMQIAEMQSLLPYKTKGN